MQDYGAAGNVPGTPYASPDGRKVNVNSSVAIIFSDDFGGTALDTTKWDVFDGGLPANASLHGQTLTQAAIGSGTVGMTDAVSNSQLVVTMTTTNGAERWYLSNQTFTGTEDIFFTYGRSASNVNNSVFFGLVEVDPVTLIPLLNPNLAAQFTNMGGAEMAASATNTAFKAQAIGDSSSAIAAGAVAVAQGNISTVQEFTIECRSEDVIVSNAAVDVANGRTTSTSRVSSQAPNEAKIYKFLMRFRNTGVPVATNITVGRVLIVAGQDMRVEVSTGRGDFNAQKATAVNIAAAASTVALQLTGTNLGGLAQPANGRIHAASAATGNMKATSASIYSYDLTNTNAALRYIHFYGKTTAPTLGTDTPIYSVAIPPVSRVALALPLGLALTTGLSYAVTTDGIAIPATTGAAGDIVGTITYV